MLLTVAIRVLLVDDLGELRSFWRSALERNGGFDVVGEAGDGAKAIEEAERLRTEAVVIDIAMPGMNGLDAVKTIREVCPETKVLVVSHLADLAAEASAAGAHDFIDKDSSIRELADRLTVLVAGD